MYSDEDTNQFLQNAPAKSLVMSQYTLQSWLESVITSFTDFIVERNNNLSNKIFPKRKQMIALFTEDRRRSSDPFELKN